MTTLVLDIPESVVNAVGSTEEATRKARELLVIELLRTAKISQGLAAEALGITRWDIFDLMVREKIASGPTTIEELLEEIEDVRHLLPRE
jgi:hypothetical protein